MTDTVYRYAILGTGRPHGSEGATGFGMAHPHFTAFQSTGRTRLIAIADPNQENAEFFLEKHSQPDATIYADYRELLSAEKPDIVSVTVWPHLHTELTVAACEAGVRAVHCEKPMALNWGDAKRMKAAAEANGTILTFNHQRRFLEPFQKAKAELKSGAIGELQRMEAACGDLFDWGTHWINMLFFFNDETPVEWVIGQIDSRSEHKVFGAATENQGLSHFKFANGVRGLLVTGNEANIGTAIRLHGTEGTIEIGWDSVLRVRGIGDADWRIIELSESIHSFSAIDRSAADLVQALDDSSHRPLLHVDNALQTTEVIYATYESSRKRGRVDLPLIPEDSALLALLNAGEIGPNLHS